MMGNKVVRFKFCLSWILQRFTPSPALQTATIGRGQIFLSENWGIASASLGGSHISLWFVQNLATNESHLQRPSGKYRYEPTPGPCPFPLQSQSPFLAGSVPELESGSLPWVWGSDVRESQADTVCLPSPIQVNYLWRLLISFPKENHVLPSFHPPPIPLPHV